MRNWLRTRKRGCTLSATLFFLCLIKPVTAATVENVYWLEVFNFLKAGSHNRELVELRKEALLSVPASLPLAESFLELFVARKQRENLNSYFSELIIANSCEESQTPICKFLGSLWRDRLSSLLFYDASATLLEKTRRAILVKDCRGAQAALKELEAREGSFHLLVEEKLRAAVCLKDKAARARLEDELEKLRF